MLNDQKARGLGIRDFHRSHGSWLPASQSLWHRMEINTPHPPPAHFTFNIKFATAARQSWSVACVSERQLVCLFFGFFPSPNSFLSETEIGFKPETHIILIPVINIGKLNTVATCVEWHNSSYYKKALRTMCFYNFEIPWRLLYIQIYPFWNRDSEP